MIRFNCSVLIVIERDNLTNDAVIYKPFKENTADCKY